MNSFDSLLTPSNILFFLAIMGLVFTVFRYFRDPQVDSEKYDALLGLQVKGLQDNVTLILSNHLPHIDQRLESLRKDLTQMNESLVKLATIIDERVPKKP